jgi:hypothetical protein
MTARDSRLTIVCAGMVAADPHHGGASWAVLQYLLGFRELGHEVYFVEPIPRAKLRPRRADLLRTAAGLRFQRLMAAFGFRESSALLLEESTETVGLGYEALRCVLRRADVLVNISGMLTDEALLEPVGRRLYLDLDPAFNQIWHASHGIDRHFDLHTHFATVGLCVGHTDCRVPTCGRAWMTTVPPVVLSAWPMANMQTRQAFTTVANWRSYGSMHYDGLFLGQKAHSLRALMDLPKRAPARFDLALAIDPGEPDLAALRHNAWNLIDPGRAAGTTGSYKRFVSSSRAEFGIAKSGYVATRSGWFSDRSACYLAAGRPVLAQDTGFGARLPTGEGLLRFESDADVLAGVDAIQRDYARHRRAARELAVQYFDSRRVLTRLIDHAGTPV